MALTGRRQLSLWLGLAGEGKEPDLIELERSQRRHRWRELHGVEVKYFKAFMQVTTEAEKDILAALGLPKIERVRQSVFEGEESEGQPWEVPPTQLPLRLGAVKRVIREYGIRLAGRSQLEKQLESDEGLYQDMAKEAYAVGVVRSLRLLFTRYPHLRAALEVLGIVPDFSSVHFRAMVKTGARRIRTELALRFWPQVRAALLDMAKNRRGVLPVARYLHKMFEGRAWYWRRITRSEATLAVNAGFDFLADRAGVQFEEWSATSGCCEVCAAFDGHVWRLHEGPAPVADTHPHCLCVRIPLMETEKPVQERWERVSPYEKPYTTEELEAMRSFFREA